MLTRRENLLIRPWQERRYIQHRKKVKAALPAIDNAPPPFRKHVCYKLKKIQREAERCTQIISDNFTLLQHLSSIMSTTRVDHFWEEPPPNFLQRVGIYTSKDVRAETDKDEAEEMLPGKTRREKCQACSPQRFRLQLMYDVRRPYTPPKERTSRKPEPLPDWDSQFKSRCDEDRLEFRGKVWKTSANGAFEKKKKKSPVVRRPTSGGSNDTIGPASHSIVLDRGGLRVAVKFPTHGDIVFSSSTETKVIKKHFCECKSFPRPLKKDDISQPNRKPGSGKMLKA